MHDLDRTIDELEYDDNEFEFESEYEEEYDDEFEFESEYDDDEYEFEMRPDGDNPFTEEEEMELASELLAVSSEEELDQFIGGLVKRAWKGAKRFAKSKAGRSIGRFAKGLAKKALPVAGRAIGTYFGGPVGGAVGGKLGRWASRLFEMELEGLSPEDQEFEVAKRIVRLTGTAARTASKLGSRMPANKAVKIAIRRSASKHAPGLISGGTRRSKVVNSGRHSGRWIRKGRRIILLDV
ncbi:hypothetical protein AAG747_05155 [Rapidithrix thailandica]|uniref:Uncharacterized protein n=1 Tax=Rapidithrix thailandica TaxID=413964 RepID=A0AAW9S311_9BACT